MAMDNLSYGTEHEPHRFVLVFFELYTHRNGQTRFRPVDPLTHAITPPARLSQRASCRQLVPKLPLTTEYHRDGQKSIGRSVRGHELPNAPMRQANHPSAYRDRI